ncbi:MAG TPA: ATP-binding protein, partial [Trueperaceae bacterium]
MRLIGVRVDGLPGLTSPLEVQLLQPGVNVIVGRNASGKSSLVRALSAVLYPDRHAGQAVVRLDMEDAAGRRVSASRMGAQVEWQSNGRAVERPDFPQADLLAAYLLRLEDLIALEPSGGSAEAGALDEHISRRLRLELTGGVDLRALRDGIPKPKTAGQKEATVLRRAESALAKVRRERDALVQRQERLAEDRQALAAAEAAAERLRSVGEARELVAELEALHRCRAELATMPPQLERLTGEESDEVSRLRRTLDTCVHEEERLRGALGAAEAEARASALPDGLSVGEAERVVARAKELCRLEQKLEQAEVEAQAATHATEAAWRRMGGVPAPAGLTIEPEGVDRVERLVQQQLVVRARLSGIRRRLAALGEGGTSRSGAGEYTENAHANELAEHLEAVRRFRSDLTRWWEARASVGRLGTWAWAVALALAAAATALSLAAPGAVESSVFATPWPAAVTSGAAVIWLLLCLVSSLRSGSEVTRAALADLHQSAGGAGVPLPSPLTPGSAARLLDETAAQVAQLERESARTAERARELEDLEADLGEATREAQGVAAELNRLRSLHGFAPSTGAGADDRDPGHPDGSPDAGFAYWLSAALEHGRASVRLAAARATVRDLEDRVSDVRSEVVGFLGRSSPDAVERADASGTDVLSACEQVSSAAARRDAAVREATDLRRALERALAD